MYIENIWESSNRIPNQYKRLMDEMFITLVYFGIMMEGVSEKTNHDIEDNRAYNSVKDLIEKCAPMNSYEEIKEKVSK